MRIFLWIGCFTSLLSPHNLIAQDNSPIRVELIIPISNPQGERELSLERYRRFHILLTNESEEAIKLWKDWNSWGYFNLSLMYRNEEVEVQIVRKNPEKWEGDFPDFWTLRPQKSIVLEVDMSMDEWDGFPDLYGETLSAELIATYENKYDPLANEFGIWVGKAVSTPLRVVFK